jgi:hypothetical protein
MRWYPGRVTSARLLAILLVVVVMGGACRKERRPDVTPTPTPTPHPSASPPPTPPPAAPISLETDFFDKLELPGDMVMLMDGGTHGVAGHTLSWDPAGHGHWERRVDSMGSDHRTGAGEMTLDLATLARVKPMLDRGWLLARAEANHAKRFPPISLDDGPPRWVWAIAMRRGDDTALLEGGGFPDSAPPEVRELLDFLADDVDARVP